MSTVKISTNQQQTFLRFVATIKLLYGQQVALSFFDTYASDYFPNFQNFVFKSPVNNNERVD